MQSRSREPDMLQAQLYRMQGRRARLSKSLRAAEFQIFLLHQNPSKIAGSPLTRGSMAACPVDVTRHFGPTLTHCKGRVTKGPLCWLRSSIFRFLTLYASGPPPLLTLGAIPTSTSLIKYVTRWDKCDPRGEGASSRGALLLIFFFSIFLQEAGAN